jgi:hypothetical protein
VPIHGHDQVRAKSGVSPVSTAASSRGVTLPQPHSSCHLPLKSMQPILMVAVAYLRSINQPGNFETPATLQQFVCPADSLAAHYMPYSIHVDGMVSWQVLPVCCACSCTHNCSTLLMLRGHRTVCRQAPAKVIKS